MVLRDHMIIISGVFILCDAMIEISEEMIPWKEDNKLN